VRLAAGTFRRDRSEDATALAGLAKVHAFPTFREIPPATIPLSRAGQAEYDILARTLFDAGRLTLLTQRSIEALALAKDVVAQRHAEGKPIPASAVTQMNRAIGELKLADVDPSVTPHAPKANKFAWHGFAARRFAAARRHQGD
jgi:hypothetical protein